MKLRAVYFDVPARIDEGDLVTSLHRGGPSHVDSFGWELELETFDSWLRATKHGRTIRRSLVGCTWETEDAVEEGKLEEDHQQEHRDGDPSGQTARPGRRNRVQQGRQKPKEGEVK